MLHYLPQPDAQDANSFISEYHSGKAEKTMLLVLADCKVDYHGRARSILDWGERLIIIKADGNVIVHRPSLREPVNWQPTGSITTYHMQETSLLIKSRHTNPPEKMTITCREIKFLLTSQLKDQGQMHLTGMEADIVNEIMQNPECIEEGLRIQKREKQVRSGLIDLYCFDNAHIPTIIEVKRSTANISNVQQLRMYVDDVQGENKEATVRGILCAPHIPDMIKHLLEDYNLEYKEVERAYVLHDDSQKTLKEYFEGYNQD